MRIIKGLKDFYKAKIKNVDKFVQCVIKHKTFYASIRKDTTTVDDLKK